jgi:hypothetical protein
VRRENEGADRLLPARVAKCGLPDTNTYITSKAREKVPQYVGMPRLALGKLSRLGTDLLRPMEYDIICDLPKCHSLTRFFVSYDQTLSHLITIIGLSNEPGGLQSDYLPSFSRNLSTLVTSFLHVGWTNRAPVYFEV